MGMLSGLQMDSQRAPVNIEKRASISPPAAGGSMVARHGMLAGRM